MGESMKTQCLVAMSPVIGLLLGLVAVFGLRAKTTPPVYAVIEADEITDAEDFKESLIKLTPYGVVESKVELEAILGSHVKSEVVAFQLCGNIEQMRRERKLMRMHLRVSGNSTPAPTGM
jgi:hypothetical protein